MATEKKENLPVDEEAMGKEKDNRNGRGKGKERKWITGRGRAKNDPSWYNKVPHLVATAANLPSNSVTGIATGIPAVTADGPTDLFVISNSSYQGSPQIEPGIMALEYANAPGVASDPSDPINLAAAMIYQTVRKANSGSKVYDVQDLTLYILTIRELYAYHAWMVRVLGVLNMYSGINRYYPDALLSSMHINSDNLKGKRALLNNYINEMGYALGTFPVPKDMPVFDRSYWLASHIYADMDSAKAQLYVYQPYGFWHFNPTKYDTGGALEFKALGNDLTLEDIIAYGDRLLNTVLYNEDCRIMAGDLLKAYGEGGVRTVPYVALEYQCIPDFEMEVQSQIINTLIMPNAVTNIQSDAWDIKQTQNYGKSCIQWQPSITFSEEEWETKSHSVLTNLGFTLNSIVSQPTSDDIMIMSANVFTCTTNYSQRTVALDIVGSELFLAAKLYRISDTGSITTLVVGSDVYVDMTPTGSESLSQGQQLAESLMLEKFNFRPLRYIRTFSNGGNYKCAGITGEVFNPITQSAEVLRRIHRARLLSLFSSDYAINMYR